MLNVDMRNVMGKHTSRYSLVTAVAKRARELVDEAESDRRGLGGKPVTLAINDLLDGRFAIIEPDELGN
ncbi:MAG: DNA-directed RNA polymerase subunit omega [Oscillospiraceae bacterium]|nr:DNA-directed RNA polymerase subunit omega [Oscillospiraceae bacterium]